MFIEHRILVFLGFIGIDILITCFFLITGSILLFCVSPRKIIFTCGDDSLKYPYYDHTIPIWVLITTGVFISVICFIATEWIFYWQLHEKRRLEKEFYTMDVGPIKLNSLVSRLGAAFGNFLVGLSVVFCILGVCKIMFGKLRPHFLQKCQPLLDGERLCSTKNHPESSEVIIYQDYTCYDNSTDVAELGRSFPSLHSGVATYIAVFLILYIQYRIHWQRVLFIRLFVQTIILNVALYCGLTGLMDYQHHSEDILWGAVIGFSVGYLQINDVWKLKIIYERIQRLKHEDSSLASYNVDAICAHSADSTNMVVLKKTIQMVEDGKVLEVQTSVAGPELDDEEED